MQYPAEPKARDLFERDIYSVSRLNAEVRAVLESSFPLLWIEGEISNLATPSSGHIYFSLKDEHAQVRCAMFRMKRSRLRFLPGNGQQVLVRARVGLYEGRGEFQLVIEHMEPAGEGALRQAFDRLKQKLAAEGLFDTERKQALPAFPRQIGVVTSPTGAAIRDVLSVLQRRMPSLPVVVYPVAVQGEEAPRQIVRALKLAQARDECDLLLLVRGGGSLEDLMAFNDESVVRAVAVCTLPVICGVGHEVDFTIADFVADRRAATPSAAAELATPVRLELQQRIEGLERRNRLSLQRRMEYLQNRLQMQAQRMQGLHPANRLLQRQQRVDELEMRLSRTMDYRLQQAAARLATLEVRVRGASPAHRLERRRLQCSESRRRLLAAVREFLLRDRERLIRISRTLDAVSPLATLSRGYAIVSAHPQGPILTDSQQVKPGERIEARLARGSLVCRVEEPV